MCSKNYNVCLPHAKKKTKRAIVKVRSRIDSKTSMDSVQRALQLGAQLAARQRWAGVGAGRLSRASSRTTSSTSTTRRSSLLTIGSPLLLTWVTVCGFREQVIKGMLGHFGQFPKGMQESVTCTNCSQECNCRVSFQACMTCLRARN